MSEHTITKRKISETKTPTFPAEFGWDKENIAASERELTAKSAMAILSVLRVFISLLYHNHLKNNAWSRVANWPK
jgi:hypothetical protein